MAFYNYTVYFALIKHICHHNISCIHYAQNDWKKANNALEIRASPIKREMKSCILYEVYDIYKNGPLSHRSVLRGVVKFKTSYGILLRCQLQFYIQ